jgi:hypothetical protein
VAEHRRLERVDGQGQGKAQGRDGNQAKKGQGTHGQKNDPFTGLLGNMK